MLKPIAALAVSFALIPASAIEYCDSGFRSLGVVVCDGDQSAIEKQVAELKGAGCYARVRT